jgi:hypothetical protein
LIPCASWRDRFRARGRSWRGSMTR